jgi:CRISPR-associated endonuclease Csy4
LRKKRNAVHLAKPYDEVLAYLIEQGNSKECKLPFINVESQESKKQAAQGVSCQFLLFIEKTLFDEAVNGKFDCYGLSKTATVPWF